jgi:hypothetical protein
MATENDMWSMIPKSVKYDDPNMPGYYFIRESRGLNHPITYHGPIDRTGSATILFGNKPEIHPYRLTEEFYFSGTLSKGEIVDDWCIICTLKTNSYGVFVKDEKIIGKIENGKFLEFKPTKAGNQQVGSSFKKILP